jgi:putative transposase
MRPRSAVPGAPAAPDLAEIGEAEWEQARRRAAAIRPLAEVPRNSRARVEQVAAELGCKPALVYRLVARWRADPRVTSLLPSTRGRRPGAFRKAPEIDELVRVAIEEVYLTRQKPTVSHLVGEVRRRCKHAGLQPPSRGTIERRLAQRASAEVLARREGRKAARDRFTPAAGSVEAAWPLSLVQIDHTLVDVIVVDSVTRLPVQRPWLTLAIDVHSRCVAGFHLSLDPPSATSVALCVAHACLPKDAWLVARQIEGEWPVRGLLDRLHLDNAKEFHSEALRRGCEQYGITIDYRPVRTPHYGGHIERLIGSMMGKVHLLPGTTFSNVRSKGDNKPESAAAMTLDEVERWLGHAIVGVYHRELHRGIGMPPLTAWARGLTGDETTPGRGEPQPIADPRRFFIDFLPLARRLVRREGVFLHSIGYWSDVLRAWVGHEAQMLVRYDPRDLSRIYLLGPDGAYYDLAYRDLRRPPISLWEHRAALRRLREEGRAQIDEEAIFRTIETMRVIADDASAATKSARRQRERRPRSFEAKVEPQTAPPADANEPEQDSTLPPRRMFPNFEVWD